MSVLGQVGSERAAEEIAAFVRKRLEGLSTLDVPLTLRALAQAELEGVLAACEEIREAARTGWY